MQPVRSEPLGNGICCVPQLAGLTKVNPVMPLSAPLPLPPTIGDAVADELGFGVADEPGAGVGVGLPLPGHVPDLREN